MESKESKLVMTADVISTFWTKGHAFIKSHASGRDYFVHFSDVIGERPQIGDVVSFRVVEYCGRQKAAQVKIIRRGGEVQS